MSSRTLNRQGEFQGDIYQLPWTEEEEYICGTEVLQEIVHVNTSKKRRKGKLEGNAKNIQGGE